MSSSRSELGAPPPNTGQGGDNVGLIIILIGGLWLLFSEASPVSFGAPLRWGRKLAGSSRRGR